MATQIQSAIRDATDLAASPQHEIAAQVGVSPLTLSLWRSGRRNPTPANLTELARVLLTRARTLERLAIELLRLADDEQRVSGRVDAPGTPADIIELDFNEGVA